jgi:hypothetical protein
MAAAAALTNTTAAAAAAAADMCVAEAAFEVLGDSSGGAGGPARGRERARQGQPPLLQGQQVFIAGGSRMRTCV